MQRTISAVGRQCGGVAALEYALLAALLALGIVAAIAALGSGLHATVTSLAVAFCEANHAIVCQLPR